MGDQWRPLRWRLLKLAGAGAAAWGAAATFGGAAVAGPIVTWAGTQLSKRYPKTAPLARLKGKALLDVLEVVVPPTSASTPGSPAGAAIERVRTVLAHTDTATGLVVAGQWAAIALLAQWVGSLLGWWAPPPVENLPEAVQIIVTNLLGGMAAHGVAKATKVGVPGLEGPSQGN